MTDPRPARPVAGTPSATVEPSVLMELALKIAVGAADLVRERRRSGFDITTKSTATDMVTDIDRASDRFIRAELARLRPDDGIVTEEDSPTAGTSGVVWVADPIDGTTNFVYDHPPYAVSLAATIDAHPVAGAIVEVSADDRYYAATGVGAFRNGERLRIGTPPPLDRTLLGTGFAYDPARRVRQAAVVGAVIGQIRDIRRLGAAAYDLCSVAAGRIDAYYEHGLNEWDLAAGQVIATEAGAVVENVLGGPVDNPVDTAVGILVAHPDLIEDLRALLVANGVGSV